MEESQDLDLAWQNLVKDSVAVDEDLADGLLTYLRDDASSEREDRKRFRGTQDDIKNPFCRGGGVFSDVGERLVEAVSSQSCPDYCSRSARHLRRSSLATSSCGISRPVLASARPCSTA